MGWVNNDITTPGGYGMGGGWGAGGMGLAAGLGGLLGAALGNGGLFGGGISKEVAVDAGLGAQGLQNALFTSSLAAADRGYQQTIAFGTQANAVDRDVLTTSYDISRQMAAGFNATNVIELQNKYDTALQLAGLGYAQEKCCCDTNQNIMKMGYETQIRDICNQNQTNIQLEEIKCLIKDTSKDQTIQSLQERIFALSQGNQTREIRDAIRNSYMGNAIALNQIGVNETIMDENAKWPPYYPGGFCW